METIEQLQTEVQRKDENPTMAFNEHLGVTTSKGFTLSSFSAPLASCRQYHY